MWQINEANLFRCSIFSSFLCFCFDQRFCRSGSLYAFIMSIWNSSMKLSSSMFFSRVSLEKPWQTFMFHKIWFICTWTCLKAFALELLLWETLFIHCRWTRAGLQSPGWAGKKRRNAAPLTLSLGFPPPEERYWQPCSTAVGCQRDNCQQLQWHTCHGQTDLCCSWSMTAPCADALRTMTFPSCQPW